MDDFIRGHPFIEHQRKFSFTTLQRKAFELDVFIQARKLGFSSGRAEKQIVHARRLCGEDVYYGSHWKLNNEVSDSEMVTKQHTIVKGVDCDRVTNTSSSGTMRSIESLQDAEKSTTKSSNQDTHSLIDDTATIDKLERKKTKRRRSTSSVREESVSSEKEKPSDSKQAASDDRVPPAQTKLQQSKSDGVNGDPSQLFEVPDDVSQYLDIQANKKRAKKNKRNSASDDKLSSASTLDNDSGKERHDCLIGHGTGDITQRGARSQQSGPTNTNEKVMEAEKKARKTEHSPRETESSIPAGKSSADHGVITHNGPRKELTMEEKAERRARKWARKQERRKLAKASLNPGPSDAGQALQASLGSLKGTSTGNAPNKTFDESHNLLAANSAEDGREKRESSDKVHGETVPQSQKHKKKKHKPKNGSISKDSGFQAPMIQ